MACKFVALTFSLPVQLHALALPIHSKDQAPLELSALQETNISCKTDEEWDSVRQMVKERRFDELRGSNCVGPGDLAAMENGDEDPDDAWEFLGCGEFDKGVCGNKPQSNCTKKQLPSLLFVGMGHAGSTSLADEMNMHEELSYGKRKEHRYFARIHGGVGPNSFSTYEDQFEVDCTVVHTFDATPSYFFLANKDADREFPWHEPGRGAITELKKVLGDDLRIMVMFRDPLDIMRSHGVKQDGPKFEEQIHEAWRMCFADSLEVWLDVFPRSSFLFLDADHFYADPQATLDKVFDFLNVAPMKFSQSDLAASGRRRTNNVYSDEVRKNFYAEEVNKDCKERLENLTGMKFDWKVS